MGCFQESQSCWACFPTSQPSPPCSRGLTRPPGPPSASARLQLLLCTEEGQETGRQWALWLLSKVLPSSPGRVGFYRGPALLSCLGFRVYPSFAAATPPSPPRPGPSTQSLLCSAPPGNQTPRSRSPRRVSTEAGPFLLLARCPQNPLLPRFYPSSVFPSVRSATSYVSHLGF